MFVVSVVRVLVFIVIWIAAGRRVWLVPHLFSDEVPISHILSPWVEEDKPRGAFSDSSHTACSWAWRPAGSRQAGVVDCAFADLQTRTATRSLRRRC